MLKKLSKQFQLLRELIFIQNIEKIPRIDNIRGFFLVKRLGKQP